MHYKTDQEFTKRYRPKYIYYHLLLFVTLLSFFALTLNILLKLGHWGRKVETTPCSDGSFSSVPKGLRPLVGTLSTTPLSAALSATVAAFFGLRQSGCVPARHTIPLDVSPSSDFAGRSRSAISSKCGSSSTSWVRRDFGCQRCWVRRHQPLV